MLPAMAPMQPAHMSAAPMGAAPAVFNGMPGAYMAAQWPQPMMTAAVPDAAYMQQAGPYATLMGGMAHAMPERPMPSAAAAAAYPDVAAQGDAPPPGGGGGLASTLPPLAHEGGGELGDGDGMDCMDGGALGADALDGDMDDLFSIISRDPVSQS